MNEINAAWERFVESERQLLARLGGPAFSSRRRFKAATAAAAATLGLGATATAMVSSITCSPVDFEGSARYPGLAALTNQRPLATSVVRGAHEPPQPFFRSPSVSLDTVLSID